MGQELQACLSEDDACEVSYLIEHDASPLLGARSAVAGLPNYSNDLSKAAANSQVLIDFTTAASFNTVIQAAVAAGTPIVTGTTGLSATDEDAMAAAIETIPIMRSANMSVGVQTMIELLQSAVKALGDDYDIAVVETHHNRKLDAPSGTAKRLVKAMDEVRDAASPPIDVHALRGGDVVGDHSVYFMGPGDRIEVTHRATTRRTFAAGALRAAKWLVGKEPGLYDMKDVLRG